MKIKSWSLVNLGTKGENNPSHPAGFVHELNQNTGLYHALVRAMEHHDRLASHSQASTSTADTSPLPAGVPTARGDPEGEGYTREAVLVGRLLVCAFP